MSLYYNISANDDIHPLNSYEDKVIHDHQAQTAEEFPLLQIRESCFLHFVHL